MARKGTAKHTYQKTRPFCVQNGNTKRPRTFSRFFAVQPIPRDLELCAPVPGSRQVSWLKAQRLPPPSQAMLSDRCKCTLAAGSLITVTRSCGICTRFPFTLSAVQCIGKRHLLFFCSVRPALYHKTAQNAIKNGILPFYKEGCRLEIEPNAELTGAHGSH